MIILSDILILFIALLHINFLVLEMFYWDKPFGLRLFGHSKEIALHSKVLAMNMGLYNGFLAAGLLWGLSLGSGGDSIKLFFLTCVLVAGIFGGFTAARKIFLIQALPAALALAVTLLI
jgi:putative membrane protein